MKPLISMLISLLVIGGCATADNEHQIKLANDTKNLGEAYLNQGDYTPALKNLLEAEKTIPKDPYLHNDLGLAYMGKQRYDLAEKHFRKAMDLKPDYIPAQNNLGAALLRQEKWDAAIECYTAISQSLLYGTPHFAASNLGWAYLGKKDYRKARESFLKAIQIKPDFINAIHGLATTYLATRQAHLAEAMLKKAIAKDPEAAIIHADMARTLEALGRVSEAIASWKTVLSLAPGTPLAAEAELRLE